MAQQRTRVELLYRNQRGAPACMPSASAQGVHTTKGVNMGIAESLQDRRTVYALGRNLPQGVDEQTVIDLVRKVTGLVPDAFNMHSQHVVVVLGQTQDKLWDAIFDVFSGKVAREKIDGFKAAFGTVLFFTDDAVVKSVQEQFPRFADNFPLWSQQSNGMLQLSVWSGLRDLGLGANLQHYNPVIDDVVRQLTDVPASWRLVAQMPFGSIQAQPDPKPAEDIDQRVRIVR